MAESVLSNALDKMVRKFDIPVDMDFRLWNSSTGSFIPVAYSVTHLVFAGSLAHGVKFSCVVWWSTEVRIPYSADELGVRMGGILSSNGGRGLLVSPGAVAEVQLWQGVLPKRPAPFSGFSAYSLFPANGVVVGLGTSIDTYVMKDTAIVFRSTERVMKPRRRLEIGG